MLNFGDYIVFVDESGDHGMYSIDLEFPIFVLAFCIFEKSRYANDAVIEAHRIKFDYFGHDQIVFHEREIRKQEHRSAF